MKLSIITINYNNREGLRKTIQSIVTQNSHEFEYIIIDGGSTDGSVDIIKEYSNYINYWISEPDRGIYHAMNKGVAKATGDYCNFINSGDVYYSKNVVQQFLKSSLSSDIITGITRRVKYDNTKSSIVSIAYPKATITTDTLLINSISHPASFIKTTLLKNNPYDESLRIVSDWKFFLEELIIKQCSYTPIDIIVVDFNVDGISNTQCAQLSIERQHVLYSLLPSKIVDDYIATIIGRTPLERMIYQSRQNSLFRKILTFIGLSLLKIGNIVKLLHK